MEHKAATENGCSSPVPSYTAYNLRGGAMQPRAVIVGIGTVFLVIIIQLAVVSQTVTGKVLSAQPYF